MHTADEALNRIILKILGYKSKYIDYPTIGYPDRNIFDAAGE